jgi:hypothetical protein
VAFAAVSQLSQRRAGKKYVGYDGVRFFQVHLERDSSMKHGRIINNSSN